MIVLAITGIPLAARTTVGTAVLAAAATALLLAGATSRLELSAAGALVAVLELELVWHDDRVRVEVAAALAGIGLLAAFELRDWASALATSGLSPRSLRNQLRALTLRLAAFILALALLIGLARVHASGPLLGAAGAASAIALFTGLLILAQRTR